MKKATENVAFFRAYTHMPTVTAVLFGPYHAAKGKNHLIFGFRTRENVIIKLFAWILASERKKSACFWISLFRIIQNGVSGVPFVLQLSIIYLLICEGEETVVA